MENATQPVDEPVYSEKSNGSRNQKYLGFCCMCGPAVGLLLVLMAWPLGAYLSVRLSEAGVLPAYFQPVLMIGMMALWPIFALGTLVGIPVGIVILNKSNKK